MAQIALERPARSNASSRPRSSAASVSDMIGIGKTQPSSGGEPDHYHSLDRTTTVNPPPLGCRLDEEKANLPENSDPHRGRRPKTNAALLWSISFFLTLNSSCWRASSMIEISEKSSSR